MKILTTPRMERCIGFHFCSLACARLVRSLSEITRKEMNEMRSVLFSSNRVLFIAVCIFCIILYSNSRAYAEEPLLCADDIEKFCKDVKPGGGRIMNCLKAHEAELTASCREKMCELQGVIKGCEQACAADISQFCKEVQPGGGRIVKCLREHEKDLSPSCSAELEKIGKRFQGRGKEK